MHRRRWGLYALHVWRGLRDRARLVAARRELLRRALWVMRMASDRGWGQNQRGSQLSAVGWSARQQVTPERSTLLTGRLQRPV